MFYLGRLTNRAVSKADVDICHLIAICGFGFFWLALILIITDESCWQQRAIFVKVYENKKNVLLLNNIPGAPALSFFVTHRIDEIPFLPRKINYGTLY